MSLQGVDAAVDTAVDVTVDVTVDVAPAPEGVLLDSRAARSCPVKTQNAHLPHLRRPDRPPDPATLARRQALAERHHRLLEGWLARVPGAVDLRVPRDGAVDPRDVATILDPGRGALSTGAPLILGARLPIDSSGRRVGTPDALVRGPDRPDGKPGYLPVIVKGHQVITADPPRGESEAQARGLLYTTLAAPSPVVGRWLAGYRLKTGSRRRDFLQLAHYTRMLAALGLHSPGPAWGGVIGTDDPASSGEPIIGWADLGQPVPPAELSFLQRYDDEHRFRLAVAENARQQTGEVGDPPLLVDPIVNAECATCPWWAVCRPQLDDDELSVRIERGRLRPREILSLRRLGVGTVTALAAADLDALVADHLTLLDDRPGAETRLRTAARRARMLTSGVEFARETSGPIELPAAEIEIDFDLETSADGRIYLWGFWVSDGLTAPHCRQFARFDDLDADAEIALARDAVHWLRGHVDGERSVRVYHYSAFEVAKLRELADRSWDPQLAWAADYAAEQFVDLLEVVKTHYFGVSGLGLKTVARHAGFRWRDSDPGGLNSQCWFAEAVHGVPEQRARARQRVLEYNEDDVIATSRLRDWLRAQ